MVKLLKCWFVWLNWSKMDVVKVVIMVWLWMCIGINWVMMIRLFIILIWFWIVIFCIWRCFVVLMRFLWIGKIGLCFRRIIEICWCVCRMMKVSLCCSLNCVLIWVRFIVFDWRKWIRLWWFLRWFWMFSLMMLRWWRFCFNFIWWKMKKIGWLFGFVNCYVINWVSWSIIVCWRSCLWRCRTKMLCGWYVVCWCCLVK